MDASDMECTGPLQSGYAEYATHYFDHHDDNNSVTVASTQPGNGSGLLNNLRAQLYPSPPIALVRWDAATYLNRWPVTRHHVYRSDSCEAPQPTPLLTNDLLRADPRIAETRAFEAAHPDWILTGSVFVDDGQTNAACYWARAVNEQDIPGLWTGPVNVSDGTNVTPSLSIRGGAATVEGNQATFTITAFPPPAPGDTITVNYTVSQQGDFVASSALGQKEATISANGEVQFQIATIDDLVDEGHGSVTVTLNNGNGYRLSSARTATVNVQDDEQVNVSFDGPDTANSVAGSGNEGDKHPITIKLDPAPHSRMRVHYTIEPHSTARVARDFTMTNFVNNSGWVDVPAGATEAQLDIQLIDDRIAEQDELVVFGLFYSSDYAIANPSFYELTITGQNKPVARISAGDATRREGQTATVTVALDDPAPAGGVTLSYRVSGSASSGSDYDALSGTVTVPAGQRNARIQIVTKVDSINEPTEDVILMLIPSADYAIDPTPGANSHTLMITDTDTPAASFAQPTDNKREPSGTHPVAINLSPAPHQDITINYTVTGTATAGPNADFTIVNSGTVEAKAGAKTVRIPIKIRNDNDQEGDETVIITLNTGTGYRLGTQSTHTLTIKDDDAPTVSFDRRSDGQPENVGTYNVLINLDRPASAGLTISYTVAGSATAGPDFSIASSGTVTVTQGERTATIPIRVIDDSNNEGDESVILTLQPGTGYSIGTNKVFWLSIIDNDSTASTPVVSRCHPDPVNLCSHTEEIFEGGQLRPVFYITGTGLANKKVLIQHVGGTATAGEDFRVRNAERDGDVYKITVTQSDVDNGYVRLNTTWARDNAREGDETATFKLLNGEGYSIGDEQEFTITILDAN